MGRARILLLSVQVCLWILFITHNTCWHRTIKYCLLAPPDASEREGGQVFLFQNDSITPPQQMRATIGVANFGPKEAFLTDENEVSQLRIYTQYGMSYRFASTLCFNIDLDHGNIALSD